MKLIIVNRLISFVGIGPGRQVRKYLYVCSLQAQIQYRTLVRRMLSTHHSAFYIARAPSLRGRVVLNVIIPSKKTVNGFSTKQAFPQFYVYICRGRRVYTNRPKYEQSAAARVKYTLTTHTCTHNATKTIYFMSG